MRHCIDSCTSLYSDPKTPRSDWKYSNSMEEVSLLDKRELTGLVLPTSTCLTTDGCDDGMQVHLEFNLKIVALHRIDKDPTPEDPQHSRASTKFLLVVVPTSPSLEAKRRYQKALYQSHHPALKPCSAMLCGSKKKDLTHRPTPVWCITRANFAGF
jgi:hypothetical protein